VGTAYLLYGAETGFGQTRDIIESPLGAPTNATSDGFGRSVGLPGDMNGDGFADAAFGAKYDNTTGSFRGALYLYAGTAAGMDASATRIEPPDPETFAFGEVISSAGDINGDGYDDLMTGTSAASYTAGYGGAVYVYYGGISAIEQPEHVLMLPDYKASFSTFGGAVSGGGDIRLSLLWCQHRVARDTNRAGGTEGTAAR
jgi:hypothetical protein